MTDLIRRYQSACRQTGDDGYLSFYLAGALGALLTALVVALGQLA